MLFRMKLQAIPTMNNYAYTIAAVSTPPGKGGVAIIRISGPDALKIGALVFRPTSKRNFEEATPRMQIRGDIYCGDEMIDDGVATYFKAPASYTGEDTVEIACHGGILVTESVLEAVFRAGARPAKAGEFTRRAFLSGKISLSEAEAIGNLIDAETKEQVKLSSGKSRALLEESISEIRKLLTAVLSSTYARIDYPDEDLGDFTRDEAVEILTSAKEKTSQLVKTYNTGRAVKDGIDTVICGKPNAGKSTLYNAIVGRDAAIVTDIEGTTRDVLSERVPFGRVILNLSDTAGVRQSTSDVIEKMGIERTLDKISSAELILSVFDLSRCGDAEDEALISLLRTVPRAKIALLNKSDLEEKFDRSSISGIFDAVVEISAKDGSEKVREALLPIVDSLFTDEKISVGEDAIISSARQSATLKKTLSLIDAALNSYESGISEDAVSSDIELALGTVAELDGRAVSEEVVADIFSKFCVGK